MTKFLSLSILGSLSVSVVFGTCNWGLFGQFPLVNEQCAYFVSPNSESSYQVVCASNGNSATLYEYDNDGCSGTAASETDVNIFSCGNSGNCSLIDVDVTAYIGSDDCSGSATSGYEGKLYLAHVNACYNVSGVGYDLTTDTDESSVSLYFNTNCSGTALFSISIENGCVEGGNSTNWAFSEGGTTDGSGGTSSSTSSSSSSSTDGNSTDSNSNSNSNSNGNYNSTDSNGGDDSSGNSYNIKMSGNIICLVALFLFFINN